MIRGALVLAAMLGLLAACDRPATPAAARSADADPVTAAGPSIDSAPPTTRPAAEPSAVPPALELLRGAVLIGKDGYGVVLCGESSQRIVALDPPAQTQLDGFLSNGAHSFHVEGWGERTVEGQVRFASFERFGVDGVDCDFDTSGFAFRALGNEPFWRADVSSAKLLLERPDQAPLSGPTRVLAESDPVRAFEAETPAGKLQVRFSPALCHDGMSEAQYGWSAEATLGSSRWSGCGFRGGASPPR